MSAERTGPCCPWESPCVWGAVETEHWKFGAECRQQCYLGFAWWELGVGTYSSLHSDDALYLELPVSRWHLLATLHSPAETWHTIWTPICPGSDSWESSSMQGSRGPWAEWQGTRATRQKGRAVFYTSTGITRCRRVKDHRISHWKGFGWGTFGVSLLKYII